MCTDVSMFTAAEGTRWKDPYPNTWDQSLIENVETSMGIHLEFSSKVNLFLVLSFIMNEVFIFASVTLWHGHLLCKQNNNFFGTLRFAGIRRLESHLLLLIHWAADQQRKRSFAILSSPKNRKKRRRKTCRERDVQHELRINWKQTNQLTIHSKKTKQDE